MVNWINNNLRKNLYLNIFPLRFQFLTDPTTLLLGEMLSEKAQFTYTGMQGNAPRGYWRYSEQRLKGIRDPLKNDIWYLLGNTLSVVKMCLENATITLETHTVFSHHALRCFPGLNQDEKSTRKSCQRQVGPLGLSPTKCLHIFGISIGCFEPPHSVLLK